jgi:hypothetical protein
LSEKKILLTSPRIIEFDVIIVVRRKQKVSKWTVKIEEATLKDLKDYLRELYKPPALENEGAVLNFMSDGEWG